MRDMSHRPLRRVLTSNGGRPSVILCPTAPFRLLLLIWRFTVMPQTQAGGVGPRKVKKLSALGRPRRQSYT